MSPEVKKIVYMPITIVSPSRVKRMGAMRYSSERISRSDESWVVSVK